MLLDDTRGYTQVPTSQAIAQVNAGNVKEANLEDKEQQLKLSLTNKISVDGQQVDQIITPFPANASGDIYNQLVSKPNIKFTTTVTQQSWFSQLLIYLIPLGILLVLLM